MLWLILTLTAVLAMMVRYYMWKKHMNSYVKHLPTIKASVPIIGNAYKFIGKSTAEIFTDIIQFIKTSGTPTKIWIGPCLTITLDQPEDVKTILMSPNCLDKPYMYRFLPSEVGILTAACNENETHTFLFVCLFRYIGNINLGNG